jgi:hypothetical protein
MARGRMIDNCISISERINDLSLREAFIYTWIIPHLDDWGRISGSPRTLKALIFPMKKEISIKNIEDTLTKFKELGLFLWEEVNGEMVLQMPFKEFNSHQSISEAKRAKSKYPEIIEEIKHKNDIPQETPEIPKNPQENPAQDNIREDKLREDNISKESSPKSENKFSDDSDEIKLSKLLFTKIKERDQKCKEPDYQKWGVHIGRLIRLDKRSPETIKKVIEWCQQDVFWQNNILSTEKLREQFTQLFLKMNKGGGSSVNTGGNTKRFSNERDYGEEEHRKIAENFYA